MEPLTCPGGSCQLFGIFGIFVQGAIGAWCMFTLLVLWWWETPRRSLATWLGDMSKQLVGACWGHFMNVFLALIFGEAMKSETTDNECVWYLLGFLSDIILMTFLCWVAVYMLRPVIRKRCGFDIGDYGGSSEEDGAAKEGCCAAAQNSPWLMWILQTGIWIVLLTVIKVFVSVGVYMSKGLLYTWVAWAFHALGMCHHQRAQLIASVIVVPVIGDAFQFAVQDGFLKKGGEQPPEPSDSPLVKYEHFGAKAKEIALEGGGASGNGQARQAAR